MHKFKQVLHDMFKVLQFSIHSNHLHSLKYLTTNLTFKILHAYHNQ